MGEVSHVYYWHDYLSSHVAILNLTIANIFRSSETTEKCSTVTWTGIQADLQQAQSDALILLDCCYAGVVDGGEGNGVTELLAACSFNSEANGVGHYSFTTALTIELKAISKRKSFTIGELYANMYRRTQSHMARGVPNERYPPPTHVLLRTDEKLHRCIQLSAHRDSYTEASTEKHGTREGQISSTESKPQKWPLATGIPVSSSTKDPCPSTDCEPSALNMGSSNPIGLQPEDHAITSMNSAMGDVNSRSQCQDRAGVVEKDSLEDKQALPSLPHWPTEKDSAWPSDAPRMLLAVRFTEELSQKDLQPDLFVDWLRAMPANIAEVTCVEAGFRCDSTLLLVSLPISLWTYLSKNPALIPMGRVMSSNLVMPRLKNADRIDCRAGGPRSHQNVETKMEEEHGQGGYFLTKDPGYGKLPPDAYQTEDKNCQGTQNVPNSQLTADLEEDSARAESVSSNQQESISIKEVKKDRVTDTYHTSLEDLQEDLSSQQYKDLSSTSKDSETVQRAIQSPESCHQSELVDCAIPKVALGTRPSEMARGSLDAPVATSNQVNRGFPRPAASSPEGQTKRAATSMDSSGRQSSENSPDQSLVPPSTEVSQTGACVTLSSSKIPHLDTHLMKSWLIDCVDQHYDCRNESTGWYIPTRLIDVGSSLTPPRLRAASDVSVGERYATLSYCWGMKSFHRLRSSNYAAMLQNIPLDDLPRTFRDAIVVTRMLDVRYLWVDSLCIIQDSQEDWQKEASQMGFVYQNAYFTIAAAAATDAFDGLFQRSDPCVQQLAWPKTSVQVFRHRNHLRHDKEPSASMLAHLPLLRRAWVFQEMVLSTRTVMFSPEQIYWECRTLSACEDFPNGYCGSKLDRLPPKPLIRSLIATSARLLDQTISWRTWTKLVMEYSRCLLTYQSDRLIAIAGVAQAAHRAVDSDYLAGLWKRHLSAGLLWYVAPNEVKRGGTGLQYVAPSWSWASATGPVNWSDHSDTQITPLIEVVSAHVDLAGANPFGQVRGGKLVLKACLARAEWDPLSGNHSVCIDTGNSTVSHLDISLHFDVDSPDSFDENAIPVVYVLPVHRYYIRPFGEDSRMTRDKMGVFCGLILEPTSNAGEYRRYGYFETSSPDFVEEICLGCEQLFVGVENRGSKDETSHHSLIDRYSVRRQKRYKGAKMDGFPLIIISII